MLNTTAASVEPTMAPISSPFDQAQVEQPGGCHPGQAGGDRHAEGGQ